MSNEPTSKQESGMQLSSALLSAFPLKNLDGKRAVLDTSSHNGQRWIRFPEHVLNYKLANANNNVKAKHVPV